MIEIDDGSICDYLMVDFDMYFCLAVQALHLVQGTFFVYFNSWTDLAELNY